MTWEKDLLPGEIKKIKSSLSFADEIIDVKREFPNSHEFGRRACYARLLVRYKFNGKEQTSSISAQGNNVGE